VRILAFNYEYPPLGGGGGVIFAQIMRVLSRRHEVTVLTSGFGDMPRRQADGGIEVIRVPILGRASRSTASLASMLSYFPSSLFTGRKLLRGRVFDVLNSHFAIPTAPSANILAKRFKVPHVLSVHGGDLYDPSKKLSPHRVPVLRGLVRHLLLAADRVVAQSKNTADNARSIYHVKRLIDVVPLGIDPPPLEESDRRRLGIPEDRLVIVTLGRLIARKALADLLQVVAALSDPRLLLVVMGEGPKREELEDLARRIGIAEQVRFTGRIDEEEKWRYLAAADLYASTSLHEGFGIVFLEAFHCGLPVVAYDCGGQTDFIEDGACGALVPIGNRTDFIRAVRQLLEDPDARLRCGAHNREIAKRFTVDACAHRYEEIFTELVSASSGLEGP
jgi:glycosyltransferase involved in cell wall biosynthesis